MAAKPSKRAEVISIEEDEALPDSHGLERFMEEVNILELEGIYFGPSRKGASRSRKARTLKELYDEPVTVSLSDYGQPSELAYKVLQAAFLKLTEQGLETDGTVLFSRRELAEIVGKKSFGGTQSDQIFTALMQLHRTAVTCSIKFKERTGARWEKKARVVSFTMFPTVAFEGSPRGRFARCAIQLDEKIVRNFQNRHVSYFNFERMRSLDMVGMMLYKRFFRHFANIYREGMDRNALKFEKDYEQVCRSWLGLTPCAYPALIERQLGKRLKALKDSRLLRECRIEKRLDSAGYKIVAYAGSGFFRDYEDIYRRKAALPALSTAEPEPLVFLAEFHQKRGHSQHEFTPKEVAYARQLLSRYSPAEVRKFMEFALAKAAETNFDMQWFGALSLYEGAWRATRTRVRDAEARQQAVASCRFCNEHGYLEFIDGAVAPCPHDAERIAFVHEQKPVRGFHQA